METLLLQAPDGRWWFAGWRTRTELLYETPERPTTRYWPTKTAALYAAWRLHQTVANATDADLQCAALLEAGVYVQRPAFVDIIDAGPTGRTYFLITKAIEEAIKEGHFRAGADRGPTIFWLDP